MFRLLLKLLLLHRQCLWGERVQETCFDLLDLVELFTYLFNKVVIVFLFLINFAFRAINLQLLGILLNLLLLVLIVFILTLEEPRLVSCDDLCG